VSGQIVSVGHFARALYSLKMVPPTEKEIKAAVKEGGKKGQDIAGMNAMGGVKFYHIAVESAGSSMELLDKVLEGFNKEVDEAAEERKGGAGDLGKILLSASDPSLLLLCHVPKEIAGEVDQAEWFSTVCKAAGASPVESADPTVLKAELKANPEKGIFPLKVRDTAINAGYEYLVSKSLIRPDDDDDDANYAEDAGIEW
jgi:hypothetical protein